MIKELENDITNSSINHAYFFECNSEEVALNEAKNFAEVILGKKVLNNPDGEIVETDEKSIKVDREYASYIYTKEVWITRSNTPPTTVEGMFYDYHLFLRLLLVYLDLILLTLLLLYLIGLFHHLL